jgi:hypothetical protein
LDLCRLGFFGELLAGYFGKKRTVEELTTH